MCSTSSSLHYKWGSSCVSRTSLQNLFRQCWVSYTWPNKCICLIRLSITLWTCAIRSSPNITGLPYTVLFIFSSYYPTENSLEVSDPVTTELVTLYQSIDLDMWHWGDFVHFYQSPQMTKGLPICCIRTPKRIGTNSDTRSFSNFFALQHPNCAFPDRGSVLNIDQFAVLYNILSVVCVVSIHPIYGFG